MSSPSRAVLSLSSTEARVPQHAGLFSFGHHMQISGPSNLPPGEVRTYCDLHRRCSSVKALTGPEKGRVVAKPHEILMRDVRFEISAAGQRRARADGVRNVHAYARGYCVGEDVSGVCDNPNAIRVRYNPHLFDTFVRSDDLTPVYGAALLAIRGKECWALSPHPFHP